MFWAAIFMVGACLNILRGWRFWPGVFAGSLNDPDSYMRLLRLGQGIAHGHLVNTVLGAQSGAPMVVEWSRLFDFLLWLLALPIAPFLGWHSALFVAGVASGPIAVGLLGVALAFAARPFAEDRLLWTAAVAAALLPGLATIALPGVVHYHIALLALIAVTAGCAARARRGAVGWAFLAGVAGGFAIWLTPETMPFVLAALATVLARFWLKPDITLLLNAAAGLFDVLGFALVIDPPAGGYFAPEIDRLSAVYLLLALVLLGAASLLRRRERQGKVAHLRGIGVGLFAVIVAAWIVLFPQLVMGPYGVMPAAVAQKFFGAMQELRPVRGLGNVVLFLLPGSLALLYALHRARRAAAVEHLAWAYLGLWILVALVLGYMFVLFAGFSNAAAAALLPVALSEARQRFRARPARALIVELALGILLILPPQLPALAAGPGAVAGAPSCNLRHIAPLLAPYAGQVVLAPAEATPELLYRAKISTVGGFYQHGVTGYLRLAEAWRSPAGGMAPPAAIEAADIGLVLFCPRASRYVLVADAPPDTLWDRLQAGGMPAWLSLAAADPATGWRLYKVIAAPR